MLVKPCLYQPPPGTWMVVADAPSGVNVHVPERSTTLSGADSALKTPSSKAKPSGCSGRYNTWPDLGLVENAVHMPAINHGWLLNDNSPLRKSGSRSLRLTFFGAPCASPPGLPDGSTDCRCSRAAG